MLRLIPQSGKPQTTAASVNHYTFISPPNLAAV